MPAERVNQLVRPGRHRADLRRQNAGHGSVHLQHEVARHQDLVPTPVHRLNRELADTSGRGADRESREHRGHVVHLPLVRTARDDVLDVPRSDRHRPARDRHVSKRRRTGRQRRLRWTCRWRAVDLVDRPGRVVGVDQMDDRVGARNGHRQGLGLEVAARRSEVARRHDDGHTGTRSHPKPGLHSGVGVVGVGRLTEAVPELRLNARVPHDDVAAGRRHVDDGDAQPPGRRARDRRRGVRGPGGHGERRSPAAARVAAHHLLRPRSGHPHTHIVRVVVDLGDGHADDVVARQRRMMRADRRRLRSQQEERHKHRGVPVSLSRRVEPARRLAVEEPAARFDRDGQRRPAQLRMTPAPDESARTRDEIRSVRVAEKQ